MPLLTELRVRLARNPGFAVVFAAFAAFAFVTGYRYPLGPGQDQHYHLMSAAVTARWWTGDASVRALYHFLNPLDANTLVYTWLFPFELALGPLRAWRVGFTLLYFVGYPLACVVALRLLRRPLWGAVLAFPLAYVKSWSQGGFIPFVSAAPFFVLAIAAMHRVLEDSSLPFRARRRIMVVAAVTTALTLLAHGHVFTWLVVLLASVTLVSLLGLLVVGLPRSPVATLRAGFSRGLGSLVVVLPALALFAQWYLRTHGGEHSAAHGTYLPSVETWQQKLTTYPSLFVHVVEDVEWGHVVLLFGVAVFAVLLSRGPKRGTLPTPEIALALSVASYFVLPFNVSGQSLGIRHADFAAWLLPLVVYPRALPHARVRAAVILAGLIGVAAYRVRFVEGKLFALAAEYQGMLDLSRSCPPPGGELAYATFGSYSAVWHGPSLHQPHETFAAICKIDAPVYDATIYPHNLLPLRYRGAPPAPITILENDARWYAHPRIWSDFRFVMVRNWRPSAAELAEVTRVAVLERESGEWRLYRAKRSEEKTP